MTQFTATERATLLAGLRLVQRFIAAQPGLVLIDDSGTPSSAAAEAIEAVFEPHGRLSMAQADALYERIAAGEPLQGDEAPLKLLRAFDREFGDAVEFDEEINGGDAVDWISDVAPMIRQSLSRISVPPSFVAAAPSVHGMLAEFDARFGDLVEDDQEIDGGDAVEWISEFALRARDILQSARAIPA